MSSTSLHNSGVGIALGASLGVALGSALDSGVVGAGVVEPGAAGGVGAGCVKWRQM